MWSRRGKKAVYNPVKWANNLQPCRLARRVALPTIKVSTERHTDVDETEGGKREEELTVMEPPAVSLKGKRDDEQGNIYSFP